MTEAQRHEHALSALRVENDQLKAHIAWLTGDDDEDLIRLRLGFCIAPREAQILLILYRRELVGWWPLYDALYSALPGCDQPDLNVIKVLMSKLRRKTKGAISIETIWGVGVRLDDASRNAIRAVLEGEGA